MTAQVITIDGPAGSGKSTVARRLAAALKLPYLDTGSMYRWVAYQAIQEGVSLAEVDKLIRIAEQSGFKFPFIKGKFEVQVAYKGGETRTLGPEIRSQEVSMATSDISKFPELRKVMVKKQQEIGSKNGAVAEGRDAGTVIFPNAPLKFFLLASPEVRARRRYEELRLRENGKCPSYEAVLEDVLKRDRQDAGRSASPMVPAPDAETVDTTLLDEEEVFARLMEKIQKFD